MTPSDDNLDTNSLLVRAHAMGERLRLSEATSGVGSFELDLASRVWDWGPQTEILLGFDGQSADRSSTAWRQAIFPDDLIKIDAAIEAAVQTGGFYVEFRVRSADGGLHWIAGRGQVTAETTPVLRGSFYEITERKSLEAKLLAMNETLEARVAELREEAHALEVLNRTCIAVAAQHDLERLVQMVTDAGVELSHASFGAFFYNVLRDDGEAYTLYTLSGVPREAFAKFPMPRNTAIFEPTFRGEGVVRSDDILADPRYGKNVPHHGMPDGHLPVRSYLAVPVISRTSDVLGGLFFGHPQAGVFTPRAERIVVALAAQAAVAIDNARLYQANRREIDARAEAEQGLQTLNQTLEQRAEERAVQLADTEQRFQHLVEAVSDYALYMLDTQGNVVNWNKGAERIKGYTREEVVGRSFSMFWTEEDRDAGTPQNALSEAALHGKYEAEGWRVRKDGSRIWVNAIINAIRGSDGELLGFAKITRDLTERRAAEERAHQAQKMEGIGQITGGVAHDFNNLLTIIIGNLETLQRNMAGPAIDAERLRRSAENAMRGARRAESLTQRLLAFSRQQPLDPKPVDLGRLVAGMSDLFRRTLGELVSIETVRGGGLWQAYVDPNQVELAILNLAVNARDAMPNGGKLTLETANVHLDEKYAATQVEVVPGQYVMLAVTDNGIGMPTDVKARAFDPFFTTKDVGHGTGLGLSQVYGFVKQSRGHVKIYSEPGEGTTLKLYFPRVHAQSESLDDESDTSPVHGSTGETILVVEDDPDVRAYSCDTLGELGYTVLEAENGRAALQLIDTRPEIRMLFTDVGLPGGLNGRQLAEEALKRRQDLKVLFTTGYARNAIVHDGRLDPGVELITKPFTQAALAAKLRDILDASRSPGRILLVEDEVLIQMLAVEFLETAGFAVDTAGSATEAMNRLRLTPGGTDAAVVDIGLPDRQGDDLVREMRAVYPLLPVVIASGRGIDELRATFKGQQKIAFLSKPYLETDLLTALRTLGLNPNA